MLLPIISSLSIMRWKHAYPEFALIYWQVRSVRPLNTKFSSKTSQHQLFNTHSKDSHFGLKALNSSKLYYFMIMCLCYRKPVRQDGNSGVMQLSQAGSDASNIYPTECRLRSITYSAPLYATIARKFDNEPEEKVTVLLGDIPVMVRSNYCHLDGLNEEDLVRKHEDMAEFGGYFIINGNERIVRMLVMTKRNYPVAFQRGTFINRGKFFTPYAVQMRCVRDDLFSQTLTLHYLSDGNCSMRLIY